MIFTPTFLVSPWYPGGFPLKPDQVTVGNKTIHEIYFNPGQADPQYSAADEETLKSYIIYYINAPLFANVFTAELLAMDLMSMPLNDVIMKCLEFGLDPL